MSVTTKHFDAGRAVASSTKRPWHILPKALYKFRSLRVYMQRLVTMEIRVFLYVAVLLLPAAHGREVNLEGKDSLTGLYYTPACVYVWRQAHNF